jgi:hypothetical protein
MSDVTCCPLAPCEVGELSFDNETSYAYAKEKLTCIECMGIIQIGEFHAVLEIIYSSYYSEEEMEEYDGVKDEAYTYCKTCYEIAEHFGCEGWSIGGIWDDIASNFFPTMTAGGPCMSGLSPESKAILFDTYINWLFQDGFQYQERAWYEAEADKADEIRKAMGVKHERS